jgi:hypothetical protein
MAIKHELIYRKTDLETLIETERKITISIALRQALTAWNNSLARQVQIGVENGTPIYEIQKPYGGLSNLIFKYLQEHLFSPVLDLQPTPAMLNLKLTADLALSNILTEKLTNLPVIPESEP